MLPVKILVERQHQGDTMDHVLSHEKLEDRKGPRPLRPVQDRNARSSEKRLENTR